MRYLKLASAKNPDTDYIELNDLNGFFCTSFQSIGISRKFDFLAINNRRFSVDNKTEFKDYILTIEILSKYSEYEVKHRTFISFLDRNKKVGFRLYYRPYDGMEERYMLCDIKSSEKQKKRQPLLITLSQNSLWLGNENKATTSQIEQEGNLFEFNQRTVVNDDETVDSNYYSVSFEFDEEIEDYCVTFYNGIETKAEIINNCYNEIPLNIKIYGQCVNPTVKLFRKGENTPVRQLKVKTNVDSDHYIEINSNILENGVWLVNKQDGTKRDYSNLIYNEFGSPYFYLDNGEYYTIIEDDGGNDCLAEFSWKEEYSE